MSAQHAASRGDNRQSRDVVLRAEGLCKWYRARRRFIRGREEKVRAVDNVDLELRAGETLGLVGESGCGKSTLARLLAALERPSAGRVELFGKDVLAMSARELRRTRRMLQVVFQDPYGTLDPRMTVREILEEPFAIHRDVLPKRARLAEVQRLLETVGLNPDHVRRYPHQFSGGQRQRIGIARALALRPRVIVCDEPTASVDVQAQAQIINLLMDLQREFDVSYIFIAHDLAVVRQIANRVAVMYLGRIVESGTDEQVYEHPLHPYTQALLSAVPIPDPQSNTRRPRILLAGDVPSAIDPPSGCRFRTRCWKAQSRCSEEEPALLVREQTSHPAACHFAADASFTPLYTTPKMPAKESLDMNPDDNKRTAGGGS